MKWVGRFAVGAGFAGVSLSSGNNAFGAHGEQQSKAPDLPWPYKKLDPAAVAEAAYLGYQKGACSYGVFEAIVGPLRKEIGFPYTTMPSAMMVVGQGGMADTASLCGALNGAASAMFLVTGGMDRKLRERSYSVIQDVFHWYEQTALPDYQPKNPKFEIARSISGSSLCHVSIAKWCKAAERKSFSKERSERCAWLTAAVARRTAEALNAHADGGFKKAHPLPVSAQKCRGCHDKDSELENMRSVTDCAGCHFAPSAKKEHPDL
ncbi:MAG: C_GCAxxG_C_C family protein [Deltaproteobacteria bacterium]|nr:C_GCAxxG_C_C family protein [Deltaproteobacteria bacterium]